MKFDRVAAFTAVLVLTMVPGAYALDLPDGQGKAVVQTACTQCHGLDVVVRQGRSREDWTEIVSRMVGNGAQLSDDDFNLVIDYLAAHMGPGSQSAPQVAPSTAMVPSGKQDK